ncbi:hypothetical protein [Saccharibacillus kuerlensis]|uniref:Uncharacterized protein n=1 Tax=Saccharibacillus kuerlensis TaxID=459527 RepID=A0ABQ2KTW4_9BACL|nr:hypothetical protein [Saccharibacillus kuerlensis]GGN92568.1 hypothetical protein GCM10010969_05200 [Saccharibacillus kuerlensis]
MTTQFAPDHSEEKISVQLTREEALALTGVRFNNGHQIEVGARKKIRSAFEKAFDFAADRTE